MPRTRSVHTILQVDPLNENRCCGLTKAGVPCNNIVALASRQKAYSLLGQCSSLPFDSRQLNDTFQSAAGLLLCKRWHQSQSAIISREWMNLWGSDHRSVSISRAEPDENTSSDGGTARRAHRPRHASRPSTSSRLSEQLETYAEDTSYERLLHSILRSNIPIDTKVSILLSAGESSGGVNTRISNNTSRISDTSTTTRLTSSNTATTIPTIPVIPVTPVTSVPTTPMPSRTQRSRNSTSTRRVSSPLPPSPSLSSGSSSPSPSSPPRTPRTETLPELATEVRQSHIECCICTEPYTGINTAFWECQQCHNRTHLECHRQWSLSDPRSTTCTYCRAIVPPVL